MLQWPCWTSCQSVSEGRRRRRGRRCRRACHRGSPSSPGPVHAPPNSGRRRRALRIAHLEWDAAPFGPSKLPWISGRPASASCWRCAARARTCRRVRISQSNACRRASSPRVDATWSTEYGRERVEELAAGGDDVLGDHDAVPCCGMHVGPHASHRAHAGGVGEVAVERGLRLTGRPVARPSRRSTLHAQVRRQPRRQGVALDVEPDVGRHPLDDGPPRHRGDLDAGERNDSAPVSHSGVNNTSSESGTSTDSLAPAHVVVSCMVNVGGAAVVPPSAARQNAQS